MALDLEGRVFQRQFVEDIEETLLVALLLGLHRQTGHRAREFEWNEMDAVLVVRVVQRAVELNFLDFGDGTDIARHQFVDLDRILALELEQVTDLEGTLTVADEELAVL